MDMNGQSEEEIMEQQQAAQEQQQMLGQANQMGATSGKSVRLDVDKEDLLDRLLSYDVADPDDPDDDLEAQLRSEFSRVYMTSNLSPREVEMMQIWSDQEAHLLSTEHAKRDSLGSGTRGQIMYGTASPAEVSDAGLSDANVQFGPKAPIPDSEERRLWSAADAKKAAITRSKGGWLIKRFTEFVAVGRTETRREEDGGGFLSGLKDRII